MLTADEQAIETRHLGFTISPHEECGVEEAVRLIEANGGSSTVLTLGPPEAEEQLRDCMSLGIDRAVHLLADEEFDGQATARAIVDVIAAEREAGTEYDIVFFGNESADAGNYQVGIRVAHALGRPCVTGVKAVALEDGGLRCEQEVAGGRDVYRVPLPAVVTVKEGLNLPRYPSVPGRLRAKKKPLDARTPGAAVRRGSKRCASSCPSTRAPRPRCWVAAPTPHRPWSSCSTGSGSSSGCRPRPRRARRRRGRRPLAPGRDARARLRRGGRGAARGDPDRSLRRRRGARGARGLEGARRRARRPRRLRARRRGGA